MKPEDPRPQGWAVGIRKKRTTSVIDLELRNVTKEFGTFTAVSDFSLQVEKGEFVSFLGPSGCGKTTTLRMIAGFVEPTHGDILIQGKSVKGVPPNHRDTGMVFLLTAAGDQDQ